ncbi:hypothetical protein [Acaricomes phytoseiuli]|uniref:hypothetical protein n=1 Tax=Acaricomes phytoseiuli TaxID=291968 RepID=UPI0012EAB9D8|nr:hypothetical protein [Acaricomes phytoseiuli]
MNSTSLTREHVHDTGTDLVAAYEAQMEAKVSHRNFHLSAPPVLVEAIRTEAAISGVYQTDLLREAVLTWISNRIDQRNNVEGK